MKRIEINPGAVYGRLQVIEEVEPKYSGKQKKRMIKCVCACGNETVVMLGDLRTGNTVSCGCKKAEVMEQCHRDNITHGLRQHPLYLVWTNMKSRCNYTGNISYHNYGARGISVCSEWENDFQAFFDWAIAAGWRPELEIDRRENNLGYNPGNCRWVTRIEQANNKRPRVKV